MDITLVMVEIYLLFDVESLIELMEAGREWKLVAVSVVCTNDEL